MGKRLSLDETKRWLRAYQMHRKNASNRGIPFLLTFIEWLTIWRESGHINERGSRRGQYCMARFGDEGAYEVGNVRICTVEENYKECWSNPEKRIEAIEKRGKSRRGKKPSEETRANLRDGQKRRFAREREEKSGRYDPLSPRTYSEESKAKMRESHLGQPSPMLGRKHSKKANEKNRQAHLGKKQSPETIAKRQATLKENPPFLGCKHSEKTKEQLRVSHLRENLSPETLEKMRDSAIRRHAKEKEFVTNIIDE